MQPLHYPLETWGECDGFMTSVSSFNQITLIANTTHKINAPTRYGKFGLMSKTSPAKMGPTTRPKLTKELLNPIEVPCPTEVRFDVNE
jgi:hypothetical protein